MKRKITSTALAVLFTLAVTVLTLTVSIGLPIYLRPFYYLQIEPLGIPEATGHGYDEIVASFDELLDYLTLPGREFSTGVFAYSEEGMSHFVDCKGLFDLNATALLVSLATAVILAVLHKCEIISLPKPRGMRLSAISGGITLFSFLAIGGLVALDFDKAFVVFHSLFFPGKDNWLFNPYEDEIILALPEKFFMNCAILIASSVIVISLVLLVRGILLARRHEADGTL